MKGRTVLLVVAVALETALVDLYAGMSAGTPDAGADPLADPPGSATKGSADKGSAPKKHQGATQAGPVRFGSVTTAGHPATRIFSMTVPLTGGGQDERLDIEIDRDAGIAGNGYLNMVTIGIS